MKLFHILTIANNLLQYEQMKLSFIEAGFDELIDCLVDVEAQVVAVVIVVAQHALLAEIARRGKHLGVVGAAP